MSNMGASMRLILIALSLSLLTACTGASPGGSDTEGPRIRVTLLNGHARPSFDTAETPADGTDHCGKVPNFPGTPARVAVALSDAGGVDRLSVRALPGEIVDSSVVAAPDWTVANSVDGGTDVALVTFRRPDSDRVLTHALVVFNVTSSSEGTGLVVEAHDIANNRTTLYQVDIHPVGSSFVCRGDS